MERKIIRKKSIDLNTSTVSSTHLLCVSFYLYIDLSLNKVILSKWIALHFEGSSSRRATKEASKSIRDINSPTPPPTVRRFSCRFDRVLSRSALQLGFD